MFPPNRHIIDESVSSEKCADLHTSANASDALSMESVRIEARAVRLGRYWDMSLDDWSRA